MNTQQSCLQAYYLVIRESKEVFVSPAALASDEVSEICSQMYAASSYLNVSKMYVAADHLESHADQLKLLMNTSTSRYLH